jgi:GNAT superfamily N-acetyltransferase
MLQNATDRQLEQAAAFNHTELFCLKARVVDGEIHHSEGMVWTDAGDKDGSMIAFPLLPEDRADTVLDEIMKYYLGHPPKGVGCWSLDPPQPSDLGVRLIARGFQPGWHPNWMSLDLDGLQSHYPFPAGLQVLPDNSSDLDKIKGLPYRDENLKMFASRQDGSSYIHRFVAFLNGRIVAHCGVLLSKGNLGAAGIYHVGVIPAMRNRGIGKAVVGAACLYAKNKEYRYAVLNGTGLRMYEQLGFRKLGTGHTWWLITSRLLANPPSGDDIVLAEAIGRGDLNALATVDNNIKNFNLQLPITNGMTLMQLAVHFRQTSSAEWLIAHHIPINVMEAWDLGWKNRAFEILSKDPGQVNHPNGEWQLTMLHMAAERNDEALAKFALSAHPDITIKDSLYKSTALDWSRHLQREKITLLLESYIKGSA